MTGDLDALLVNAGDDIRAEDHNGVVRAIRSREFRAGPGVLIRDLGTHRLISYRGAPRTAVNHAWKPRRANLDDGREGVRFARGLVNGIEPVIGKKKISDPECEPLLIPGYDVDDMGDCLIYVELTLDLQTWQVKKAEMAAYSKRPAFKPFTARKLVAVANIDNSLVPRAYFDLGFDSSQRKPSGSFKSWWRAMP
jgi:hypothetical protein